MISSGGWASGYGQFMAMDEKPMLIDVRDSLGDVSRAHAEFEYVPRYGMEDGLKGTIGWFGGCCSGIVGEGAGNWARNCCRSL